MEHFPQKKSFDFVLDLYSLFSLSSLLTCAASKSSPGSSNGTWQRKKDYIC